MKQSSDDTSENQEVVIVYDRQCPACEYYCTMIRLRESVGHVVLLDARDGGPIMEKISDKGLDIDQGMVVKVGERLYYGADAIHALALMSTRQGLFNRVAYWAFRSPRVSRLIYPLLRACRNLLLKLLGKTRINNLGIDGNERF